MRMGPCVLGVALTLGSLGVCATSSAAGQLAVFRIDPLGVDPQIVAKLDGLLRIELSRLADSAMPTASAVRHLLRRNRRAAACVGAPGCLAEVGALLKVDRIISGNVGGLGDSYVVNLKIVDVASAKELRKVQETISGNPDQLIEAIRVAAYGLVAPHRLRGGLAVLANVPGAEVFLDGRRLGRTPLPTQLRLKVGQHTLMVRKLGYRDVVQTVRVRFQKTALVEVELKAPEGPGAVVITRRPLPWYTRWWFWTAVGVVAAGAGVGLGLGVSSSSGVNCSADPARCGLN